MPEATYAPGESAPLLQTTQRSSSTDQQVVEIQQQSSPRPGAYASNLHTIQQQSPSCSPRRGGHTCNLHRSPSSNSSNGGGNSSSGPVLGTCRICFESETADNQDPANPLISPCLCSGGSRHVHRQCLAQWRTTNHRADAFYQCEVCKYRYEYRRLWWAGILGSQVTLTVLFLILMSGLIAVLGFVPVLGLLPSGKGSSSGGGSGGGDTPAPPGGGGSSGSSTQPAWVLVSYHVANGLITMGILGLLVSMLFGILRACGYTGLFIMPDPFCPACLWCLDLNGGPGIGWAPFIECSGAAGECGLALLVVLVVVMLIVGITAAAYMLYAVMWALVQQGLDKAQSMVENVQQEHEQQQPAVAEAKH